MKVVIYNWAGDKKVSETLDILGYKHNEEVEVEDPYHVVKVIYEMGLNVMLRRRRHGTEESAHMLIACDSRGFGQR